MTSRVRSLPSRFGKALCLPRIVGVPSQVLKSVVVMVLCIHAVGTEILAHNKWGCLLSHQEMRPSRPENGVVCNERPAFNFVKLGCVETGGKH